MYGTHKLSVFIEGKGPIVDSLPIIAQPLPFLKILEPLGHHTTHANTPFKWRIQPVDIGSLSINFNIHTPDCSHDQVTVTFIDSIIEVNYTPLLPGLYKLQISIEGLMPQCLELNVI